MNNFYVKTAKLPLQGVIIVDGDKSCSHRALMLSSQMLGVTRISGLLLAEDVLATKGALIDMGVKIIADGDDWLVYGNGLGSLVTPENILDLGNSGTGVRLLLGLVATLNIKAVFTGDKSLNSRPMLRVLNPLKTYLCNFSAREDNFLPVEMQGNKLAPAIKYEITTPSAQVKSALLLAALNAYGNSQISEKTFTRDHTEIMLNYLGFSIQEKITNNIKEITIQGKVKDLKAQDITISGDPSSAAFMVAAALLVKDSHLIIQNILINKYRIGFYEILKKMGADISFNNIRNICGEEVADIEVKYSQLHGIEIDASYAPSMIDEYPILSILATKALGSTKMYGLAELKVKESNRLNAIIVNLRNCGVNLNSGDDWLEISYSKNINATKIINSYHDHRIAMSFIILGLISQNIIEIDDISMIKTSFPNFFTLLKKINAIN
jgi:3-phosphoshikimate 1-carboxyvinyltransferase